MATPAFERKADDLRARYLRDAHRRPASSARGVHHLAMIARDVEETIRFYQDLLGWPLVELLENRDYAGSTHFFFDLGHGNLLGFFDFPGLGLGEAVETIGSMQHVAISVTRESFEMLKQRLDQAGIEYLGPDRGLTDSVYFTDPNGIQLELLAEPLLEMDGRRMGG